jgi:FkbM family methyltransferase
MPPFVRGVESLFTTLRFITSHPLNKEHKLRAIYRFCKWQVGARLVPGAVVWEWIQGSKLIIRHGETGLTQNLYCGLHEFPEMAFLLHALSPDDLFVDIGSNVGSYSILAAAAKGARTYCFEPIPSTFERLLANLRVNDVVGRATALNIGLSDREAELWFTTDQDSTNHVVPKDEQYRESIKVQVLPLDSVLAGQKPTFMKNDVEGFEKQVLAGAHQTLSQDSLLALVVELEGIGGRYGSDDDETYDGILSYGFSPYTYDPFRRSLQRVLPQNRRPGNVIFVRNEEAVARKITQCPRIAIQGVLL